MRNWVTRLFTLIVAAVLVATSTAPRAQTASMAEIAATQTADDVRIWDRVVVSMTDGGELRLRRVVADTLVSGRSHERFDQYYKGVRVFGADVARQSNGGMTESVFGVLYQRIDVSVDPTLTEDDAAARVRRLDGAPQPTAPAELVILPRENTFALAYRIRAASDDTAADYFVDARTGDVLLTLTNIQRAAAIGSGTGVLGDTKKVSVDAVSLAFFARDMMRPPAIRTYDMKGNLPRVKSVLSRLTALTDADLASTANNNTWSDPAVVDAHAHMGMVYDFYFKRFGRHGIDDRDLPMIGLVHPVLRSNVATATTPDLFMYYVNAFWNPDVKMMVYGDGLPPGIVLLPDRQSWNYVSGGLDIVGHELTHGVTQFTSALIYRNESGALNESFSDMMGTSVEFFHRPAGSGPLVADYLIGSDIVHGPLNGVRSMADPSLFGDPDHYSRRYIGTDDSGGVHTNSGISNNAFYLAIEGGVNRTSGLSVQGVGSANREQIEKVFYRAFAFLLPADATFSVARAATIQAARDLYGAGSAPERAVTQAWTAVGVN